MSIKDLRRARAERIENLLARRRAAGQDWAGYVSEIKGLPILVRTSGPFLGLAIFAKRAFDSKFPNARLVLEDVCAIATRTSVDSVANESTIRNWITQFRSQDCDASMVSTSDLMADLQMLKQLAGFENALQVPTKNDEADEFES